MITHLKWYVTECFCSEGLIGIFSLRPHLQDGPLGITKPYNKYVLRFVPLTGKQTEVWSCALNSVTSKCELLPNLGAPKTLYFNYVMLSHNKLVKCYVGLYEIRGYGDILVECVSSTFRTLQGVIPFGLSFTRKQQASLLNNYSICTNSHDVIPKKLGIFYFRLITLNVDKV